MSAQKLVIVDGVRTPFSKLNTSLSSLGAVELGQHAVKALLTRTGIDPHCIDETIIGCVAQPADATNIARVIALRAGIPQSVPAMTVNRNCASGLESLTVAYEKMQAGNGEVFIVGGTESMTHIPLFYPHKTAEKFTALARSKTFLNKIKSLSAFRPADFSPRIGLKLGLTDPVSGFNMGETAELLAREYHISREEQDAFSLESHKRALAAEEKFSEEICPIYLTEEKTGIVSSDNGPREDISIEKLTKLRPYFDRKYGTITAGNASQITDGAVALLVMSEDKAKSLNLEPLGSLSAYAYTGCDPARMGLGPAHAIAKAEKISGLTLEEADFVEINEAFSAQVLAVLKCLESQTFGYSIGRKNVLGNIPLEKLNPNGGAIALGHPVGATGARLILTSLKELQRRKAKRALVSLCVGGGQGAAVWLESL